MYITNHASRLVCVAWPSNKMAASINVQCILSYLNLDYLNPRFSAGSSNAVWSTRDSSTQ